MNEKNRPFDRKCQRPPDRPIDRLVERMREGAKEFFSAGKSSSERVGELFKIADDVRESAPAIWMEMRTYVRHPRALGALIEARSPWLSRRIMSAASNFSEPFTAGMGLSVVKMEEDIIEVAMPGGWRNRGEGGLIHTGALAALGESTVRSFWDFHLDLRSLEIEARQVRVRILSTPEGDLRGVFRLPEGEREAILHRLRAEQKAQLETQTMIYGAHGRLIAEVEIDWRIRRLLVLGSAIRAKNDAD